MVKNKPLLGVFFPKIILFFSILFYSCLPKPVINSFTVTPLTITVEDTVKVNWDVKGKPTLLVHQKVAADSGVKYLELTLVVEKGAKEVNRPVQVTVVPTNSTTQIIFSTDLKGDTLIAADDKNPDKWGNRLEILSVSSASARQLIVWHANKTAVLDKAGTLSTAFEGTPVEGRWVFKSQLTADEKKGTVTPPATLEINATIRYKRR